MSALSFTAGIHARAISKPSILKHRASTDPKPRVSFTSTSTATTLHASFSDPFVLQLAETLEDSIPASSSSVLQTIRESSSQSLLSTPWPSLKDEAFRFTDTSVIKSCHIEPISMAPQMDWVESEDEDIQTSNLLITDGFLSCSVTSASCLPDGVYVGSLPGFPDNENLRKIYDILGETFFPGDLFWSINGLGAPDIAVIYVPAGVHVSVPIHLRYVSVVGEDKESKKLPVSNPKVLVVVEDGGEVEIVEEFCCDDNSCEKSYWANAVVEVIVGKGAKVLHSYLQGHSLYSAHTKWTSVRQESDSTYGIVEISTGGKLSRHNLYVQQLGPDTVTKISTLHLCVTNQTQDLHSKLILDHPRGVSQQLHKCIVAHSQGQAVFDGNVQVNRYAQQTDASQLTRSLLLESRATVNVKPNLQIIADDVKCSHGAAICDLEDSQLFYFQARGIDMETARKALILSFAGEVVASLPNSSIRKKVESSVKSLLDAYL